SSCERVDVSRAEATPCAPSTTWWPPWSEARRRSAWSPGSSPCASRARASELPSATRRLICARTPRTHRSASWWRPSTWGSSALGKRGSPWRVSCAGAPITRAPATSSAPSWLPRRPRSPPNISLTTSPSSPGGPTPPRSAPGSGIAPRRRRSSRSPSNRRLRRRPPAMIPEQVHARSLRELLAPIGAYLDDPLVSEILVNGADEVYVERRGRLERTDARFPSVVALLAALRGVAQFVGHPLDAEHPILEGHLPDGSRLQALI